jgi:hypothetical protein
MRMILQTAILAMGVALTGCASAEKAMFHDDMTLEQGVPGSIASFIDHRVGQELPSATVARPVTVPAAPQVLTASAAPDVARSIIYNAGLQIVVPDIATAQRAVQQQAAAAQGYLQELDGSRIIVRVPAAKFESVLMALEKLGEVTGRHVKANDVTEEMRDLNIRLENAQEMRKRLTDLIAKADKIEDTIKLEEALERVTQTIELIKGRLLYLKDQVAFSTIGVQFNSPRPQMQGGIALPFAWVKELGDGAVTGAAAQMPDTSRVFARNERFALPAGFVRYFERDHTTEAMSADDVVIKLRRQDNYDGGDLAFWGRLARRVLVENRAIAVESEKDMKVKDGSTGRWIAGTKDQGARKQTYLLGMVATKRYVYTFEAWGDQEKMASQRAALEAAFGSLDVKHW